MRAHGRPGQAIWVGVMRETLFCHARRHAMGTHAEGLPGSIATRTLFLPKRGVPTSCDSVHFTSCSCFFLQTQHATLHLASGGHGQLVNELNFFGVLVGGEQGPYM